MHRSTAGTLRIEVHTTPGDAGRAAAALAAEEILRLAQSRDQFGVIFATGASQLETLRHLRERNDLPWEKVIGFHMDEYVGINATHRASFRGYLRKELPQQARMKAFYELNASGGDLEDACAAYTDALREVNPSLCLLGVGENGHLAFNDPWEADFNDPRDVRLVNLDGRCRQQQYAEGWFDSLEDVPLQALTLTIPALMRVPMLVASVPGSRKSAIVQTMLTSPISPECPATILRTHRNATMFLDQDSSARIVSLLQG